MRAIYLENHGDLDQIKYGQVESPQCGSNDVIVEPQFSALNHLDLFVTKGWSGLKLKMPHILGSDGAGIIKFIGQNVTTVKVGDRVTVNPGISCGKCSACLAGHQNYCKDFRILGENLDGTFADQLVVPEINVMKIPDSISFEIAAAAPLTFLTAWQMLVTKAAVKMNDWVFIQGVSGGIGSAALQIAKLCNAKVVVSTSSVEKVEKAYQMGADFVFNYTETPDFYKNLYKDLTDKRGVDIVVDCVGTNTFTNSLKSLRTGGKLVTCGGTTGSMAEIDIRQIFWKQLEIYGSTMGNHTDFQTVMQLIFQGKLKPIIDKVFPFHQARDAETYLQQGKQFGKILLKNKE